MNSLAEVVAGDVLDHLAARLGHRAVGQHDRDADDEVAHAAVAVAQRAGVGGRHDPADRSRRSAPAAGPSASIWPCSANAACASANGTPASRIAVKSPTLCSRMRSRPPVSSRPPRRRRAPQRLGAAADRPHRLRRRARARAAARRPPATRLGPRHSEPLRQARRPRADAGGTGPGTSPHSRGVGITLPGLASPAGSNAQRRRWNASRSASPNIFGMCFFLSTPTPCSPVIEPPASRQASRIRPDSSSARSASPSTRAVVADERVQVAVAGVEDVGDDQPVLLGQLVDPLEHLGQLGARDHAVLDEVVGRDPAHRRERRLAASSRSSWRSASSRATRTSSEPQRSQIATTSSKRASHSLLGAVELDQQRRAAADRDSRRAPSARTPRSPARPSSRSRPGRRRPGRSPTPPRPRRAWSRRTRPAS